MEMRTEILQSISNSYPNLFFIPIPEDINEVVVGLPSASMTENNSASTRASSLELDSIEVKDALAKIVTKNSGGKFDT